MPFHFVPSRFDEWRLIDRVVKQSNLSLIYQYSDIDAYLVIEEREGYVFSKLFVQEGEMADITVLEIRALYRQIRRHTDIQVYSLDGFETGGLDLARLYIGFN